MAGIFPNPSKGAVVPAQATNAYTPIIPPVGTAALYYPDCPTKIEGATLNAIISLLSCMFDKAGIAYDPSNPCALADRMMFAPTAGSVDP